MRMKVFKGLKECCYAFWNSSSQQQPWKASCRTEKCFFMCKLSSIDIGQACGKVTEIYRIAIFELLEQFLSLNRKCNSRQCFKKRFLQNVLSTSRLRKNSDFPSFVATLKPFWIKAQTVFDKLRSSLWCGCENLDTLMMCLSI